MDCNDCLYGMDTKFRVMSSPALVKYSQRPVGVVAYKAALKRLCRTACHLYRWVG